MAPDSPPTESKILILEGHIAGEKGLIALEIDWRERVIDLKELIKDQQKEHTRVSKCTPDQLIVYKLGDEGFGYNALRGRYDLDEYTCQGVTCSELEDIERIYACWPADEKGAPSNKEDRLHFVVGFPPEIQGLHPLITDYAEREAFINDLARDLREWCESGQQADLPQEDETVESLGDKFPLQQCLPLLQRLESHMLDSFKYKYFTKREWLKEFSIAVIGAGPGTGKATICSRLLDEMAMLVSAPQISDVSKDEPQDLVQHDVDTLQGIIADSEGHLPEAAEPMHLRLHEVWTEERLADFRRKVLTSADRKLTLQVDLMNTVFNFDHSSSLASNLAGALLDAYSKRLSMVSGWKMRNHLTSELGKFQNPVGIALCVLRVLENDNIIVIHLDETQEVSSENLQTLVKLLVKKMNYDSHEQVPWIFPILSGLSLEMLLDSSQMSGAQVECYTPPILSITSMLNITRDLFYTGDHNGKQLEQPVFQPGYIRLLHDLRGPTRLFQAALLIIHDFSNPKVVAHEWSLQSPINREVIRAGLEKPDQDWNAIFDC
ncbi:hypothetical protein C0992_013322, partial [Termitomyces sp. T32_za158]